MSIQGLQRLEVWRKAKDFAVIIHQQVLPLLPLEEKWSANQQLRRSAQSVPANLNEPGSEHAIHESEESYLTDFPDDAS